MLPTESFAGLFREPTVDYAFGLAWSERTHVGGYFSFGYDF